jgi:hypothetical protein
MIEGYWKYMEEAHPIDFHLTAHVSLFPGTESWIIIGRPVEHIGRYNLLPVIENTLSRHIIPGEQLNVKCRTLYLLILGGSRDTNEIGTLD